MNNEKSSYNQIKVDFPKEEIPEVHSSEPSASDIEKANTLL